MSFIRSIRRLLPRAAIKSLGAWRMKRRVKRLSRLSTAAAFDEIYRRKMWRQGESLSGPGSEGLWATAYAEVVSSIITDENIRSIIDVGCGDFEVGKLLAPLVDNYVGLDVSSVIIDRNRQKYHNFPNVEFELLDITESIPAKTDLVLIRQVLQHLTNRQIESALQNVDKSGARIVVVAEHSTLPAAMAEPNLDLPSHSVMTRVSLSSGVDVRRPPFNRRADLLKVIPPGDENLAEAESALFIYRLTREPLETA